jgi:CBS domain-containing protein
MRRWIYAYRYVKGDPKDLERTMLERGRDLLQLATAASDVEPAGDGTFLVHVQSRVAGLDLAKQVRVSIGVARRKLMRVILPVAWHADPARIAFPAFEGSIELEPLDRDLAQLTVVGSYMVPLGPLGVAADVTVLRQVGDGTADRLAAALARELERATASPAPVERPGGPRQGQPLVVRDVMTVDPLVIPADAPLRTAALMLFHAQVSGAPVVDDDGALVGVLSEHDLLAKEASVAPGMGRRAREEDRRRHAVTVGEACSRPAFVTAPDARLSEATREMLDRDVSRLAVVDGGRVAGIVTRHDVLAAFVRDDAELQYAIQRVLDDHRATDVDATVQWGEVTLTGTARLRSTATQLPQAVSRVDGVIAVHTAGLTWLEDDVIRMAPSL